MKKSITTLIRTAAVLLGLTACGQKAEITRIKLSEYSEMNIGETVEIVPAYEAGDADEEKTMEAAEELILIWTSSDENIATVDNGIVTGVSFGEAIITVSTEDNTLSAETTVKVKSPVESIEAEDIIINENDVDIEIKYSLLPEGVKGEVSFSIADESITTVKDGKLSAVKAGETELIIKADDKENIVKIAVNTAEKETEKTAVNESSAISTPVNNAPAVSSPVTPIATPQPDPIPVPIPEPTPAPVTPPPASVPEPRPPAVTPDAPLDNNQNVGDSHNPGYSPADKPVIED